jgi:hypothetical protein
MGAILPLMSTLMTVSFSAGCMLRAVWELTCYALLWVVLSKLLGGWEDLVHLMKPETVKRWHTKAFGLFWRWRSRPGRPPVSSEMQQLIRQISRDNPLWGPDRIRDTLLLLGYDAPCTQTICKYMVKPRKPRPQSTNGWRFCGITCTSPGRSTSSP